METHDAKVIGIDPGSNTLGLCCFTIDTDLNIKSIKARTIVAEHLNGLDDGFAEVHGDKYHRLRKLYLYLKDFISQLRPVIVASEAAFYNRFRPNAYMSLIEVIYLIRTAVIDYNEDLPLLTYSPITVKKSVGCNKLGKDDVRKAISDIPEIMEHLEVSLDELDEHSVDAIAVAYTVLTNYRNSKHAKNNPTR